MRPPAVRLDFGRSPPYFGDDIDDTLPVADDDDDEEEEESSETEEGDGSGAEEESEEDKGEYYSDQHMEDINAQAAIEGNFE